MKRQISIIFVTVMILSSIFTGSPISAIDFNEQRAYKLSFTAQEMTNSMSSFPFSYSNYNCMTSYNEVIVSSGYTNIVTYRIQQNGLVQLKNLSVAIGNGVKTGRAIEFSITDKNGNILYPSDRSPVTINENNPTISGVNLSAYSVLEGDEINFIYHGMGGSVNSLNVVGVIEVKPDGASDWTRVTNASGRVFCLDKNNTQQGSEGFYFRYATDYEKIAVSGLNLGAVNENKLNFTKRPMTVNSASNKDSFPLIGKQYFCMSGYHQKTASSGYANVVTYVMPEDGKIKSTVQLGLLSANYANQSLDFCVTDGEGNILYPTDKRILTLNADLRYTSAISFSKGNLKKGDEINYVFFNAKFDLSGGADGPVASSMVGTIAVNDKAVMTNGSGNYWPQQGNDGISNDGAGNLYFNYSTDVEVVSLGKASWNEFVKLEEAYDSAPQTIEAWVNIPQSISDDKKMYILGNSGECNFEDDLSIELNYGGRPRLSAGVRGIDFTVDTDIRTGEWTHLAFVNDVQSDTITCYINGQEKGVYTGAYGNSKGTQYPFLIGNNHIFDKKVSFQGEIKDVIFRKSAIDQEQVEYDMENFVSDTDTTVLGAYRLTDYSSSTQYFKDVKNLNNGKIVSPYDIWIQQDDAVDYDYSMAVIGDTQYYSQSELNYKKFVAITDYIAQNAATKNTSFVMQVGDLVSNAIDSEYQRSLEAISKLKQADIPYSIALGNHDTVNFGLSMRESITFNRHYTENSFSSQKLSAIGYYPEYYKATAAEGKTTYTVVADETENFDASQQVKISDVTTRQCEGESIAVGDTVALKVDNRYQTFTAGNTKYLILTLEVYPRDSVIDWANGIVASYSDHKTIIVTHAYQRSNGEILSSSASEEGYYPAHAEPEGKNLAENIWSKLASKHENIFMILSGHSHDKDISQKVRIGENGNTVYSYMVAPTDGDGGDGVFLMMYFNETANTVEFRYYSPVKNAYYKTTNTFKISLDDSSQVIKGDVTSNINEKAFNLRYSYTNGNTFASYDFDKVGNPYFMAFQNKSSSICNVNYAVLRKFVAQNAGNGEFLVYLGGLTTSGGTVNWETDYIDFAIYNTNGKNITGLFNIGSTAQNAVAGINTTPAVNNGSYVRVYKSSGMLYLYTTISDIAQGDSFYFVTSTDCATGGGLTANDRIFIAGDIINEASLINSSSKALPLEGEWAASEYDFDRTNAGTLGWYNMIYAMSDFSERTEYTPVNDTVKVRVSGQGNISMLTSVASYDSESSTITLPHDNSLYFYCNPDSGYELASVMYNGVVLTAYSEPDGIYNIPCPKSGEISIVYSPKAVHIRTNTDSVPNGCYVQPINNYTDYGTIVPLFAENSNNHYLDSWLINGVSHDASFTQMTVTEDTIITPVFVQVLVGDVNNDGEMNTKDLIRLKKYFADQSIQINLKNADLNNDTVITTQDMVMLIKLLLS